MAKGLFAKIIAESGASPVKGMIDLSLPLDSAEARGVQFERTVGASDLQQLRKMPAEKLLAAFKGIGTVIVDG